MITPVHTQNYYLHRIIIVTGGREIVQCLRRTNTTRSLLTLFHVRGIQSIQDAIFFGSSLIQGRRGQRRKIHIQKRCREKPFFGSVVGISQEAYILTQVNSTNHVECSIGITTLIVLLCICAFWTPYIDSVYNPWMISAYFTDGYANHLKTG